MNKIKKFQVIGGGVLVLALGCFFLRGVNIQNSEFQKSAEIKPPYFMELENIDRQKVGIAVKLGENLYFTPDHIFGSHKKGLFFKSAPIKIISRDFLTDVLFFRFSANFSTLDKINPIQLMSDFPAIGEDIFLMRRGGVEKTKIAGYNQTFDLGDEVRNGLISIEGVAEFGESGSPVFNERGRVLGILIGSDRAKNVSYLISAEILKQRLLNQK